MDEQLGMQELEEVLHAKEAHSRAVVLESVRTFINCLIIQKLSTGQIVNVLTCITGRGHS